MNDLILTHTNESDVIIDPFMGTGATCEAAMNNNRQFIGIEKEKKYFETALKRFKKF